MLEKTTEYVDRKLRDSRALDFTRYLGAQVETWNAKSRGHASETPSEIFKRRWPKSAAIDVIDRLVERAAVPPHTGLDPTHGAVLATPVEVAFVTLARAATLIGRLPVKRVPLATRIIVGGGAGFAWAGAGLPKAISAQSWESTVLPPAVAASIVVVTEEVIKLAVPGSVEAVTRDLANGLRAGLDRALVDPAAAGVPDRIPASITNGVTPIASAGDPLVDLKALTKAYRDAGGETSTAAILLSSDNAVGMHLDSPSTFPDLTVDGGTIAGLPAFASSALEDQVVMLDVSRLVVASDDRVDTSIVTGGAIQMSDAPVAGASNLVSLWQNNLVGIRIETFVNWTYGGAIAIVNAADYLSGV